MPVPDEQIKSRRRELVIFRRAPQPLRSSPTAASRVTGPRARDPVPRWTSDSRGGPGDTAPGNGIPAWAPRNSDVFSLLGGAAIRPGPVSETPRDSLALGHVGLAPSAAGNGVPCSYETSASSGSRPTRAAIDSGPQMRYLLAHREVIRCVPPTSMSFATRTPTSPRSGRRLRMRQSSAFSEAP